MSVQDIFRLGAESSSSSSSSARPRTVEGTRCRSGRRTHRPSRDSRRPPGSGCRPVPRRSTASRSGAFRFATCPLNVTSARQRTICRSARGGSATRFVGPRGCPRSPVPPRILPGQVDLVHAAGLPYSSLLFAGVRLAERTGARLVMSPFTHVAPPGPAGARHTARLSFAAQRALALDALTGSSCRQSASARCLPRRAWRPSAQTIVGLGVEPSECTGGSRERGRRAWKVADGAVVVGHLANKSWDKGTVDLLDAAERLWDKGVSFVLVLAGSEMRSFSRRWARVRFPERVVNLGELSDEERRDFFAAIDVFALPSYVESFGVTSLEAALNGAAVVAYDHGGPGEIFRDGDSALLAPVGNVDLLAQLIERSVTNASGRARLGAAACRSGERILVEPRAGCGVG